jgi:hypothetical protein
MSPGPARLKTLAFGGLDAPAWGAAFAPDDSIFLAVGDDQRLLVPSVRVYVAEDAGDWHLDGDHAAFIVSSAGDPLPVRTADDELAGAAQLCRVTGRFELDGAEQTVDSPGLRTWSSELMGLDRFQSIRAVSSWFGPDEGFALTALRPRKAKAHDADLIAAAVLGPDAAVPVSEPRLSTTYSADGWPTRAGLELWLGEDEQEQYPRRASGEATGPRAEGGVGGLELRAERFRWHSRGKDGAGVYVVAQRG